jgi:hypothetical protein
MLHLFWTVYVNCCRGIFPVPILCMWLFPVIIQLFIPWTVFLFVMFWIPQKVVFITCTVSEICAYWIFEYLWSQFVTLLYEYYSWIYYYWSTISSYPEMNGAKSCHIGMCRLKHFVLMTLPIELHWFVNSSVGLVWAHHRCCIKFGSSKDYFCQTANRFKLERF